MKQIIFLLVVLSSYKCYAQSNSNSIIGKWLKIPKEDLIIEVYRANDEYKGKISWAKDNDKRKPVGFVILEKLKYSETEKTWDNGKIHNPASGSSYSATAKIKTDGTLEVLAYKGMKFFGVKKYFKRVK